MSCAEKINHFCYICGHFVFKANRRPLSEMIQQLYSYYYGLSFYANVPWAPNIGCKNCCNALLLWYREKREKMTYKTPMIWSDPGQHNNANCYVCTNTVRALNQRTSSTFLYTAVPSAQLPTYYEEGDTAPKRPSPSDISTTNPFVFEIESFLSPPESGTEYIPSGAADTTPRPLTQTQLNNLVRKLNLSKSRAEELARTLKESNLLAPNVKITGYRTRHSRFLPFFTISENRKHVYCNDIDALMVEMGIRYIPEEWRLFIDSSKSALKAVLLYYDNSKNPVPLFYAIDMAETYESMKYILEVVNYNLYEWKISGDLKVIAFLSGLQQGNTKHSCFLCTWDSRYHQNQYQRREWPMRGTRRVGFQNVIHEPLVPFHKILLPPLHIKLGIVKNFVKTIERKNEKAFECLKTIFPSLSKAKIKEGNIYFFYVLSDIHIYLYNAIII